MYLYYLIDVFPFIIKLTLSVVHGDNCVIIYTRAVDDTGDAANAWDEERG